MPKIRFWSAVAQSRVSSKKSGAINDSFNDVGSTNRTLELRRGHVGARQRGRRAVRRRLAADLLVAPRGKDESNRHRSADAARRTSSPRDRAESHAGSRARHGRGGHRRAIKSAGRQRNSFANVRRFWKRDRPPTAADRRAMAHHPSSPAVVGQSFHQVRNLRNGHQGH